MLYNRKVWKKYIVIHNMIKKLTEIKAKNFLMSGQCSDYR